MEGTWCGSRRTLNDLIMVNLDELSEYKLSGNKRWVVYTDGSKALLSGSAVLLGKEVVSEVPLDNLPDKDFLEIEPKVGDLDIKKVGGFVIIRDKKKRKVLKKIKATR